MGLLVWCGFGILGVLVLCISGDFWFCVFSDIWCF